MDLVDLPRAVPGLATLSHADRIRVLAWWLNTQQGRDHFSARDIIDCYGSLHMEAPSVHPFLASLLKQGQLLKSKRGYRLALGARQKLDDTYGRRAETVVVDDLLAQLPALLPSAAASAYLTEALACFRNQCWRSAVVMTWNVAYDLLLHHIVAAKLAEFNAALLANTERRRRQSISSRDDLSDLREGLVLEVSRAGDVISGSTFKQMKAALDTRNEAAHPSGLSFNKLVVESYISALIETVIAATSRPNAK